MRPPDILKTSFQKLSGHLYVGFCPICNFLEYFESEQTARAFLIRHVCGEIPKSAAPSETYELVEV